MGIKSGWHERLGIIWSRSIHPDSLVISPLVAAFQIYIPLQDNFSFSTRTSKVSLINSCLRWGGSFWRGGVRWSEKVDFQANVYYQIFVFNLIPCIGRTRKFRYITFISKIVKENVVCSCNGGFLMRGGTWTGNVDFFIHPYYSIITFISTCLIGGAPFFNRTTFISIFKKR